MSLAEFNSGILTTQKVIYLLAQLVQNLQLTNIKQRERYRSTSIELQCFCYVWGEKSFPKKITNSM